jgi:hypothetical protein
MSANEDMIRNVGDLMRRVRAAQEAFPLSDPERAQLEREDRLSDPTTPEGRARLRRRRLAAAGVVAADVVELAPQIDPTGVSAVLAAKVVRSLLLLLGRP